MELAGKCAIVTGGSRGIGAAIALDLAANGANVAINFRRQANDANAVVKKMQDMGRKAVAVQADVAAFADAQKLARVAQEELGGLHILVCNAGVNRDAVIWKMTEAEWDEVIATDLKGYFNYCRAVAPVFKEQKQGKIVNITSINGMRGKFGQSNYSAAKAGIIGFTKSLARELGKFNVNVNAVAPGLIETDMVKNAPQDVRDKALADILLGRIGQPEEVARVVSFLVSEKARHITGEVVKVDGGQYL